MRLLTTVPKWWGHRAPDLTAQFHDEIIQLAPYFDRIIVVTEGHPNERRHEQHGNVEIHRVRIIRRSKLYGLSKILGYLHALFILALSRKVDVVYIRQFSPPDLLLTVASKLLGVASVQCVPGTWLFMDGASLRRKIYRWLLRLSLAACVKVILYSPRMIPDVKNIVPSLDLDKVVYVGNGVDTERFKPLQSKENLRSKHQLPRDSPVILYAGRITPMKGVEDLIQAARLLADEIPTLRVMLVGIPEGKYLDEVKKRITKLHLERNVSYIGPIPNENMPEYYSMADVFVYPSRGGEGIPRAILEAMASAKPVVATSVAGTAEAVQDGQVGFLVAPNAPEQLAKRLALLVTDKELARKMGENGRRWVEAHHSWKIVAPRLSEALKTTQRR